MWVEGKSPGALQNLVGTWTDKSKANIQIRVEGSRVPPGSRIAGQVNQVHGKPSKHGVDELGRQGRSYAVVTGKSCKPKVDCISIKREIINKNVSWGHEVGGDHSFDIKPV